MIQHRYLLIAYFHDKPKDDEHTRRKYISKFDYDMLTQDAESGVEIEEVQYTILSRYAFDMNSTLTGTVYFLIIEVQRHGATYTVQQSQAAG